MCTYLKGRSKTPLFADDVIVCIKCQSTKKPLRTNKWVQQGHRIQDQHTKINYISIF